jgi:hypothetical protein
MKVNSMQWTALAGFGIGAVSAAAYLLLGGGYFLSIPVLLKNSVLVEWQRLVET